MLHGCRCRAQRSKILVRSLRSSLMPRSWEGIVAAAAKLEAARSAQSAQDGLQREMEAVKASFEMRREEQVAEVLSRLEGEHFRLSVEVAQEARSRTAAEEEATELQTKLNRWALRSAVIFFDL
eukprot:Skav210985  [mRNA]  locus=scaffold1730:29790:31950:- [translate_table: standard]